MLNDLSARAQAFLFSEGGSLTLRKLAQLLDVKEAGLRELSPFTMAYMNRLSSLLFALARLANHLAGVNEETPRY